MVAIIGGLKRGEREYLELLKKYELKGKVYNTQCPNFCKKIKNCEICVVFTNLVSHNLVNNCSKICKTNNIPIVHLTSNSINNLKERLDKEFGNKE
ncbi:DUF2325 domain-containing protein [Cetobacterium sp.]|uniref:DUF2325 domain-containing protein n=1 Tax=Cetobacterium sp. TaxID=2071632 RepID=UPI002FC9B3F4